MGTSDPSEGSLLLAIIRAARTNEKEIEVDTPGWGKKLPIIAGTSGGMVLLFAGIYAGMRKSSTKVSNTLAQSSPTGDIIQDTITSKNSACDNKSNLSSKNQQIHHHHKSPHLSPETKLSTRHMMRQTLPGGTTAGTIAIKALLYGTILCIGSFATAGCLLSWYWDLSSFTDLSDRLSLMMPTTSISSRKKDITAISSELDTNLHSDTTKDRTARVLMRLAKQMDQDEKKYTEREMERLSRIFAMAKKTYGHEEAIKRVSSMVESDTLLEFIGHQEQIDPSLLEIPENEIEERD